MQPCFTLLNALDVLTYVWNLKSCQLASRPNISTLLTSTKEGQLISMPKFMETHANFSVTLGLDGLFPMKGITTDPRLPSLILAVFGFGRRGTWTSAVFCSPNRGEKKRKNKTVEPRSARLDRWCGCRLVGVPRNRVPPQVLKCADVSLLPLHAVSFLGFLISTVVSLVCLCIFRGYLLFSSCTFKPA